MHPKVRSPLVSWLLTVVTGGIYLFYWVWQVATELNHAENRTVLPVKRWRNSAFLLLGLTAAEGVVGDQAQIPLLFFIFVCLLALFIHVQISIGNYIKAKDAELATGGEFSNAISVVLLWLLANTGVAYMQSGINRVIRYEQARS